MDIKVIKKRLLKDRPRVAVAIRMPEDVLQDLKRVAHALGFTGHDSLLRHYVGQGLRADLDRLEVLERERATAKDAEKRNLAEFMASMPDAGEDLDFERTRDSELLCPRTGTPMVRAIRPLTLTYAGQGVTFDMPGWYCPECPEAIYTPEDMAISDRELAKLKGRAGASPSSVDALGECSSDLWKGFDAELEDDREK